MLTSPSGATLTLAGPSPSHDTVACQGELVEVVDGACVPRTRGPVVSDALAGYIQSAVDSKVRAIMREVESGRNNSVNIAKLESRVDSIEAKEDIFEIPSNNDVLQNAQLEWYWTCSSYFGAEVVITMSQTNGGPANNKYIRGIWHNNHQSHNWEVLEDIGSISSLSELTIIAADQNGRVGGQSTNNGKLLLRISYNSGSFSGGRVTIRPFNSWHGGGVTTGWVNK